MTSLPDWPVAIRTPAPGAELTAWPNGVCQQLEHLSAFHDRVDRLAELIAKTVLHLSHQATTCPAPNAEGDAE
jgi:hypothetical protein